jgi:hypothetical protein
VLGQDASDTAHRHYLGYLLDPHGSHGLGSTLLAALLRRAGRADLAADPAALAEARVGTDQGPFLVVTAPHVTLAVTLLLPGSPSVRQEAAPPGALRIQLTPSGRPGPSAAVRPVSLLQLSRDLAAALRTPADGSAHQARGRALARDYLNTLEDLLGMSPANEAAARFWLTHQADLTAAQQAARDLLTGLPDRTHAVLAELAPRLGDDLATAWIEYDATGDHGSHPEVAVILGRRDWLTSGRPRCGFGLGQRLDDTAADHPPFVGFYCEDDRLRDAVSTHFGRTPWARHWARRALLPLRPEPRLPLLDGLARRVAESVTMGWREDGEVMERLRAG